MVWRCNPAAPRAGGCALVAVLVALRPASDAAGTAACAQHNDSGRDVRLISSQTETCYPPAYHQPQQCCLVSTTAGRPPWAKTPYPKGGICLVTRRGNPLNTATQKSPKGRSPSAAVSRRPTDLPAIWLRLVPGRGGRVDWLMPRSGCGLVARSWVGLGESHGLPAAGVVHGAATDRPTEAWLQRSRRAGPRRVWRPAVQRAS